MLTQWLERIVATEMPAPDVVAFNIGLLETDKGFTAYLVGSKSYDPNNDDWACNEDFTPTERYCALPSMRSEDTWETVQHRVAEEMRAFLSKANVRTSFLGKAEAVTVGFDDGELLRVL